MLPLSGPSWVEAVLVTAAVLGAFGVIWRKGFRPAYRGIRRLHHAIHCITESAPVLQEIAKDFKPRNGNGSLGDVIDEIKATQIEEATARKVAADRLAAKVAAAAVEIQVGHDTLVETVNGLAVVVTKHVEDDTAAFARIEAHQAALVQADTAAHEAAVGILHEKAGVTTGVNVSPT